MKSTLTLLKEINENNTLFILDHYIEKDKTWTQKFYLSGLYRIEVKVKNNKMQSIKIFQDGKFLIGTKNIINYKEYSQLLNTLNSNDGYISEAVYYI